VDTIVRNLTVKTVQTKRLPSSLGYQLIKYHFIGIRHQCSLSHSHSPETARAYLSFFYRHPPLPQSGGCGSSNVMKIRFYSALDTGKSAAVKAAKQTVFFSMRTFLSMISPFLGFHGRINL
jgi:hypothetical protein